jgi:hypothetical protein
LGGHRSRGPGNIENTRTLALAVPEVKTPSPLCRLFGMGVGIHLISRDEAVSKAPLDLLADHISFTCNDLQRVEQQLKCTGIPYAKQTFVERNITISQ